MAKCRTLVSSRRGVAHFNVWFLSGLFVPGQNQKNADSHPKSNLQLLFIWTQFPPCPRARFTQLGVEPDAP
jgi:hypothetical protein